MKVMFLKKNYIHILRKMSYDCSKISGLPEYVILDDILALYPGHTRGSTLGISGVTHFPYLEQICNFLE